MSNKLEVIGRYGRPAAEFAAASAALIIINAESVTVRNHRELTHRSVTLHRWIQKLADIEQSTLAVAPKIWAAVHRVHHSIPDATLFPFYRISRALQWMEKNPHLSGGVTIPEFFPNLDPYVNSFSRADVQEIGNQAAEAVKTRLGDNYELPTSYTKDELVSTLNPKEPAYYYTNEKHVDPYSQDEVAEILLGDPHSPVRVPPPERNGVRGVLKRNVLLYGRSARLFRVRPELREPDLRDKDDKDTKVSKLGIATGILIPSAGVLLRRGKFKPKDFVIAVATGSALYGVKAGWVVAGGNIVNSLGHAGNLRRETLTTAIRGEIFKPPLNPDGTVSTDTSRAGILGRGLSRATFDEVGGQAEHHRHPEKIAYTSKTGREAWKEAPWGMILQTLAENKWFSLIKPGPGFDIKEGERRPDQHLPAMDIIHRRRVEQMAANT